MKSVSSTSSLLLQAQFPKRFHTEKSPTQGRQKYVAQKQSDKIAIENTNSVVLKDEA